MATTLASTLTQSTTPRSTGCHDGRRRLFDFDDIDAASQRGARFLGLVFRPWQGTVAPTAGGATGEEHWN
jgi:hypothetical protein